MKTPNMNSSSKYHLHPTLLLFFLYVCFYIFPLSGQNTNSAAVSTVDVGLILDMDTIVGKVSKTCITMALEDFYANHQNYTTRIVLHHKNSNSDVVEAASAAIDLLKSVQVKAILGPQRSTQADFVTYIGNKTRVPIISQATSPTLSSMENPYFVRGAETSSSQVEALTAIVKAFYWHEVVLIYEDSSYGRSMIPYVTEALLNVNVLVKHQSVVSVSATDDHILEELYKLMTMQTRVFVVNMLPALASRFFPKAKQAGMMSKGYVWIITDVLTSLLDSLDPNVISSMQGVLGVKPHVPKSKQLDLFNDNWRKRFRRENPDTDRFELNVFGLWAYDSVHALARAVERAGIPNKPFQNPVNSKNLTDLATIGTSEMGPRLLQSIRNIRFKGLSGDFHLIDGELQSSDFEIVNVIGKGERELGFWSSDFGISRNLKRINKKNYTTKSEDLGTIIWPGESHEVPRGWDFPTNEKKLRVGVPVHTFSEFIKVDTDPRTHSVNATGFCVDVFIEILNALPYSVPYEFFPFETPNGTYNDLVYQIYLGVYDAVVGDVTIRANRSNYVDFSLPYTEADVAMVVPIKGDDRKNAWIFMKPLTINLWLTTVAFFLFTGFVVWVLEHGINKEFRGPPCEQIGMIFWFSFSTMVFAHKEKLISNLSRFVVVVWVFLALILTSSYTASLTSMLTVQKLQPTLTEINDLIRNGEYVGFLHGSFVHEFLLRKGISSSRLKDYLTVDEFDKALAKGSKNGGIGAYVDELPYLRLLVTKYCTKYTIVGPTYKTAGLGFAFPKGSPLVPDISRGILSLMEDEMMARIEQKWFGNETTPTCVEQTGSRITSDPLSLDSFKGLFLIAGISSLSSLIVFFSIFLYENREILSSDESIKQKLTAIAKKFDQHKENSNDSSSKSKKILPVDQIADPGNIVPEFTSPNSPAVSISNHGEGIFTREEGFSATEPGTPIHEIEIVWFSATEPETPVHEMEIVGADNEERRDIH